MKSIPTDNNRGNRDPSDLTFSEMLRCIARLGRLPDYKEVAAYLSTNPEYFPRFVRDSRSAMLNIEHIFVEEIIQVSLHPANDPQYRIAAGASFSTKDQSADRPTWVGESQFGDDLVKVLATPADPIGRRVKITIWLDNPKTISAGECLFISFTETAGSQAPESVELKAIDARIQGSASIAMTWTDFLIKANSPLHITRHPATN